MKPLAEPARWVRGQGSPGSDDPAAAVNGAASAIGNGHGAIGNGASANGHSTSSRVLVLNASFEPINVCTVRRATVLLLKAKAEIVERGEHGLRTERHVFERPVVIRLVTYVRIPRDVHRRKITRKAVLARDAWTCQYCGSSKPALTVDHVIPRSRGGKSIWENIVASCAPCNRRKGNRLPREVEMHPRTTPRPPGPTIFIRVAAPRVPTCWEPYLSVA